MPGTQQLVGVCHVMLSPRQWIIMHYSDVTSRGLHGASNHWKLHYLVKSCHKLTIKNGSNVRITGPLWEEAIGIRWIPPQRDSSVQCVPMVCSHHGTETNKCRCFVSVNPCHKLTERLCYDASNIPFHNLCWFRWCEISCLHSRTMLRYFYMHSNL